MSETLHGGLRPIERRLRTLSADGTGDVELAWRFQRTPRNVRNILAWSQLRREPSSSTPSGSLRPIERCVLRWRDDGADVDDLAARFRRRPASIAQIEQLARYKLAR